MHPLKKCSIRLIPAFRKESACSPSGGHERGSRYARPRRRPEWYGAGDGRTIGCRGRRVGTGCGASAPRHCPGPAAHDRTRKRHRLRQHLLGPQPGDWARPWHRPHADARRSANTEGSVDSTSPQSPKARWQRKAVCTRLDWRSSYRSTARLRSTMISGSNGAASCFRGPCRRDLPSIRR